MMPMAAPPPVPAGPTSNVPNISTPSLKPMDEAKYRTWMRAIGHTPENGMAVSPNLTGHDYDYRGFFQKYGPVNVDSGQHLTDEFKLPNHPTFSVESKYATGPYARYAGSWQGDRFVPPQVALAHAAPR